MPFILSPSDLLINYFTSYIIAKYKRVMLLQTSWFSQGCLAPIFLWSFSEEENCELLLGFWVALVALRGDEGSYLLSVFTFVSELFWWSHNDKKNFKNRFKTFGKCVCICFRVTLLVPGCQGPMGTSVILASNRTIARTGCQRWFF